MVGQEDSQGIPGDLADFGGVFMVKDVQQSGLVEEVNVFSFQI